LIIIIKLKLNNLLFLLYNLFELKLRDVMNLTNTLAAQFFVSD